MPTDKRARQRANREEARARRQRDERRAKLRRNVIRFGGVGLAVVAAGFFLSRNAGETPATTVPAAATSEAAATTAAATTTPAETPPTTLAAATGEPVSTPEYEAFRALPVACGGTLPQPATTLNFPNGAEDQGLSGSVRATLRTSCGDIVLRLDADAAPVTVNSFAFLARSGFYDGTVSHRIVPGFVYQAGDPTARGNGGPGYRFEDELPPADFVYVRGTVAMANSGPDTNGSQFFIVFQDSQLPPDFTVFGEVESGLDVLDRIEAVPVVNQQPQEGVFIEGITIEG